MELCAFTDSHTLFAYVRTSLERHLLLKLSSQLVLYKIEAHSENQWSDRQISMLLFIISALVWRFCCKKWLCFTIFCFTKERMASFTPQHRFLTQYCHAFCLVCNRPEFLGNPQGCWQRQKVGMSRVGTLGFAFGFGLLGWRRTLSPCQLPAHLRTGWFPSMPLSTYPDTL